MMYKKEINDVRKISPPPPSLPPMLSLWVGDHYLSHLQWAKYIRKPYVLVSRITKISLQLMDGVKTCISATLL